MTDDEVLEHLYAQANKLQDELLDFMSDRGLSKPAVVLAFCMATATAAASAEAPKNGVLSQFAEMLDFAYSQLDTPDSPTPAH